MFKLIWSYIRVPVFFIAGLVSIVWYAQRRAIGGYKQTLRADVEKRENDANEAVADAATHSPAERDKRMRKKGWYRGV